MDKITFWCLLLLTLQFMYLQHLTDKLSKTVSQIEARIEVQKVRADEIEQFIGLKR